MSNEGAGPYGLLQAPVRLCARAMTRMAIALTRQSPGGFARARQIGYRMQRGALCALETCAATLLSR